MEILCFKNLSFTYPGGEKALNDISFSVNAGEFIVVMGESGCGKTTLLKMIKKELTPAGEKTGEIYYKGIPLDEVEERTRVEKIGYVMQIPQNQIVTDKVYHELSFSLESLSINSSDIRIKVGEMSSYFGLEKLFRKNTHELSGGETQLVNLASVMVTSPEILILDEPTSQLDPIAASEFIATLRKLNVELGLTIILVEHRLEEVFSIADRVMVLENGSLLKLDTPKNVGVFLKDNKMLKSAPAAVRLYNSLWDKTNKQECPVNVKEGKDYLISNFDNRIKSFSEIKERKNETDGLNSNTEETNKVDTEESISKVIELKNIWFRYEKSGDDILRGLNLTVNTGEILCLLGGNGAGKSTVLSVIAGLRKPYRGKVFINGKNIKEYKNGMLYRNNLTMLPQNPVTVFVKSTVEEDFMDILCAVEKKQGAKEKIAEVSEIFGITHLLNRHPYDLSGGEMQRCAIAKLLLLSPKILLLDEPTKGIDGCAKEKLINILKDLKSRGITVLMVTHDVEFAAGCADRCGLLFDGEILALSEPHQFFNKNTFYTTAVNRMSRDIYEGIITGDELKAIVEKNGRK